MLETTRVVEDMALARQHAELLGLADQFEEQLAFLENFRHPEQTRCVLRPDGAPYSFLFTMERLEDGEWTYWFGGGLIYHGPHDTYGSGSAPSFSVMLKPHYGWSIHT